MAEQVTGNFNKKTMNEKLDNLTKSPILTGQRLLVSIDPGLATGVSVWSIPDESPINLETFHIISGGPDGFLEWWDTRSENSDVLDRGKSTVVCEQFIQDGRTPRVDTSALHIEGILKVLLYGREIIWQRNSVKKLVGDKVLKQHGYWKTGKQIGWTDGRDVNDSFLHALHWARINHRPSVEFFWPKATGR